MKLQQLARSKGYQIRHFSNPLKKNESFGKVVKPFDFSVKYGGTVDSMRYYNNYYLYPITL